ncbi:MAG: hypothetical protein L6408_03255 [Nanoarchaeota archaeon]|nr:hypothetical protein [Nanoarchaeota archaeon]
MTLYLVGKSLDSKLFFASDGWAIDPKNNEKNLKDVGPKMFPVEGVPGMIIAIAGMSRFGYDVESIIKIYYERSLKSPVKFHPKYIHKVFAKQEPWLHDLIDSIFRKVKEGLTSKSEIYSQVDIFSFQDDKPIATKLAIMNDKPHLRNVGFESGFKFPFYSVGMSDFANETLLDFFMRNQDLQTKDNLRNLFLYIISETEKREFGVGGNYWSCLLDEDKAHILVYYGPKEENREYIEKGKQLLDQSARNRIKVSPDLVRKAVKTLEDLDVLRRLCDKNLMEIYKAENASNVKDINNLALFFIERYLDLIPKEALEYRTFFRPIMIEPQLANIDFLEIAIQKFEQRISQPQYNKLVGRAKICLADQKEGPEKHVLYKSSIPLLEKALQTEYTGVDASWLGKTYSKIGRANEAEKIFLTVLEDYKKSELRIPDQLAVIRSLKGMYNLGKSEFRNHFIEYATKIIKEGKLSKEMIKRT